MVNQPFLNQTSTFPVPGKLPGTVLACYDIAVSDGDQAGTWQEVKPAVHDLPVFISQLIIITSVTRIVWFAIKPLRQPRIVAEIIAGTLMGPSVMGRIRKLCPFLDAVFSVSGAMTLEAIGNMGLVYVVFLLGLEIDLTKVSQVGKKAFSVALVGTIFPFVIGMILYHLLLPDHGKSFQFGAIFWGVALTDSGLSVTTQILAKLKLLYTDIGKTTMSSGAANEIISWGFITVLLAIGNNFEKAPRAFLSTIGFFVFCYFVVRPAISWLIFRKHKNGHLNEQTICIILTLVLACGLATDLLGTSSIVGAFVLGLVIPSELVGPKFAEMLRGFVEELLMPIFFADLGFRTNYDSIMSASSLSLVILVIALAYLCKIVSSVAVSFFYGARLKEGIALGVLMNTKGLLPIIIIYFARDHMVMEDKEYTVLLIAILVMTMATQPVMSILYKSKKRSIPNKHRAIQKHIPGSELRVLACIHEAQSVSGIINLLEASNPSSQSPLTVFALQLVQLTGHTSALLLIHGSSHGSDANQILDAFKIFGREQSWTSVQQQIVVSEYATMHVDICSIAEDKRASFIILPFHKRQTIHDDLENTSQDYKDVNDNVLLHAPCSIGIFVDRGFGRFQDSDPESEASTYQIAMVYLGGPDDREALSYAKKMATHPNASLTVVRFVESRKDEVAPIAQPVDLFDSSSHSASMKKFVESRAEQLLIDNSFVDGFREETANDRSIVYMEKEASDGADIIGALRVLVECYDLFIVGRGTGVLSPLKAGLEQGTEHPELGPIGDLLVTSQFSASVSVLVMQQYKEPNPADEGSS